MSEIWGAYFWEGLFLGVDGGLSEFYCMSCTCMIDRNLGNIIFH